MPRADLEFADLTRNEREKALFMARELADHFPLKRATEICRAMARCDALVVTRGALLRVDQLAFPMSVTTLLRDERTWAIGVLLALTLELGEHSSERVVAYLASRNGLLDAIARLGAGALSTATATVN